MADITLFKSEGNLFFKQISKKEDIKDFDCDGFLLDCDEKQARRTIEFIKSKDKNKLIGILALSDEFNRRALETLKINYLISPEFNEGKDTLKQRSSGFNHVLAEIAKKKNIQIVVNLSKVNSIDNKKEKAKIVSRILQNVKISRKSKIDLKLATFANSENELLDEKQIRAIGFSLGMSSQQVSNCLV